MPFVQGLVAVIGRFNPALLLLAFLILSVFFLLANLIQLSAEKFSSYKRLPWLSSFPDSLHQGTSFVNLSHAEPLNALDSVQDICPLLLILRLAASSEHWKQ